ncbi:hypothetical protein GJAV_G00246780 [Gymnothorax javanicus]|nr:hypothetical protein GJAV_G00246780 [Gymnothorax javanicus]
MERTPFQRFPGGPQQSSYSGYSDQNAFDSSGAFSQPPLPRSSHDSPCSFRNTSTFPSENWSGPTVYPRQTQQTSVNSQMLNYGPTEWAPRAACQGRPMQYRPPLPPQHTFSMGHQNTAVPRFDPTRPPPPLYEPQPVHFPSVFDDRRGPVTDSSSTSHLDHTHQDHSVQQWQQGADMRTPHEQGAPAFNARVEEHKPYPNSGPPIQTGFQNVGCNVSHYQIQSNASQVENQPAYHGNLHGGNIKERQPPILDEEAKQRLMDKRWLVNFMQNRKMAKSATSKQTRDKPSISQVRETLYAAARLVSQLSVACERLKENVENEHFWTESYPQAVAIKNALLGRLDLFGDPVYIETVKNKLALIRKKRSRIQRKKRERVEEKIKEDSRVAEREAAIDKWRMKRIQRVEEKKRELELKAAADSVLSEVRKKQADAKRMLDILRSLEKLRKLRKEAAARKGIFPEKEADEVFEGHVERLRKLIRKRTAVYAVEEQALRVMLEGEQEEERKKEQEKRQKKEREKFLQKKLEVETMLFGEEMHPHHPLQPFKQCYTQAEHSLHALIQIRRDWDAYLVPADHPDGSFIPQGWVLPEPPSDETWASALEK